MRNIFIYSLKPINDRYELSIDLIGKLLPEKETNDHFTIQLSKGPVIFKKYEWINRDKIYDDGKVFFLVCNKQVNRDYAEKRLREYAMSKMDRKIEVLCSFKEMFKNEINRLNQKLKLEAA